MVFLFDCDNDEILLPRAYDLIDDSKAFIDLMRKTEVKDMGVEDGKAALKAPRGNKRISQTLLDSRQGRKST